MLKEYLFYSPKFEGEIYFAYDMEDGSLMKYELRASLTIEQFAFLRHQFPFTETELIKMKAGADNKSTIKEIQPDLSFERFWNEYGHKVGKRKMAENYWYRLSESNKMRVFAHIPRYKQHCKVNHVDMAYPSTYLNQEYWKN